VDPVTLFALANGAVSAVKAGCKLYKDIKSAAGDVKGVLQDLDDQFNKKHKDKPATVAEKNQLIEEKNRVRDLNRRAEQNDHTNIYKEIGEHLGTYYDNYFKCQAIFEEEERRHKNQAYHGEDSLGKRALQRVLMRKQLEAMGAELREIMVYQSPPELGALYTEVEEMMKIMGKEQKVALAREIQLHRQQEQRRQRRQEQLKLQVAVGVSILVSIFLVAYMFMLIVDYRQHRYPELGTCLVPKGSYLYKAWTSKIWATCE
jgi:hypothetical protein